MFLSDWQINNYCVSASLLNFRTQTLKKQMFLLVNVFKMPITFWNIKGRSSAKQEQWLPKTKCKLSRLYLLSFQTQEQKLEKLCQKISSSIHFHPGHSETGILKY